MLGLVCYSCVVCCILKFLFALGMFAFVCVFVLLSDAYCVVCVVRFACVASLVHSNRECLCVCCLLCCVVCVAPTTSRARALACSDQFVIILAIFCVPAFQQDFCERIRLHMNSMEDRGGAAVHVGVGGERAIGQSQVPAVQGPHAPHPSPALPLHACVLASGAVPAYSKSMDQ